MGSSRRLLLGLLALAVFCLPCFAEDGDVTLTRNEFQMLKTALQMADSQLEKSENEISTLQTRLVESQNLAENLQGRCESLLSQLNEQDKALETLEKQLDSALESLTKLKNETRLNNVILVIVGVVGVAFGGSLALLIVGGR